MDVIPSHEAWVQISDGGTGDRFIESQPIRLLSQ
jgi:hypothetical protein